MAVKTGGLQVGRTKVDLWVSVLGGNGSWSASKEAVVKGNISNLLVGQVCVLFLWAGVR